MWPYSKQDPCAQCLSIQPHPFQPTTELLLKRLGGKEKVDSEIDALLSDGLHWPAFFERIAPLLWPAGGANKKYVREEKHVFNVYYNNRRNIFVKARKKAETRVILQAERDARKAEEEALRLQTANSAIEPNAGVGAAGANAMATAGRCSAQPIACRCLDESQDTWPCSG